MTKSKQKPTDTTGAETGLDYRQLAEQMLGSWQDQWRQFATNKDNPFAAAPMAGYTDWMSSWSNAMSAWTNPMQQPTAGPAAAQPTAPTSANTTAHTTESAHAKPAAPDNANTTAAPTGQPAGAQAVPPSAAAASNARDVLLTELARRVEFLHERVVALESELEKLRAGK